MGQRKSSPTQAVNVNDLFALIPPELYERLAAEFKPDKWVHKLHASVMVKLILYSILHTERLSLRVMETMYAQPDFQILANAVGKTAHNSIRDRLRTVSVDYFAALYAHFYEQVEKMYGAQQLETKYAVRRFDSTMVRTFAHLLQGMRVGSSARQSVQVKFTMEYRSDVLLRATLHTDQAYLSEERALGQAVEAAQTNSREVIVFDRGLQNRATFEALTQAGKHFVTRLQRSPRYELVEILPLPTEPDQEGLTIQQHAHVQLYGSSNKRYDKVFRLVEATNAEGHKLLFVTNLPLQEASAHMVAQLYRQRWDIEVLFRFLKQEMNLNHFVCHDPNACAIMLYGLLIAATMVLIYKKLNAIESYKQSKIRFVKELVNSIIYDMLQTQEGIEKMKKLFKPKKE